MEAFVITLREGIEAALIVGLVLIYLRRTSQTELNRWVYGGLGLAVAASLLGALALSRAGLDPEDPLAEGILLAVAAVLVLSLVAWMWRTSRSLRHQIHERLDTLTTAPTAGRRSGWALLLFVFVMILREGIETVVFLGALSLARTPDLIGLAGGLAGIALAALFGVLFVRGTLRVNLRRFFAITGVVLVVLALRLAAGSVHEFAEIGLLPLSAGVEGAIDYLIADSTSTLILIALIALPVISLVPDMRRPATTAASSEVRAPTAWRWQAALVGVTLVTVVLLAIATFSVASAAGGPPVGGCPDDFHLHALSDHDEGHMGDHRHVGLSVDLNGDGYLCVKHAGDVHVHIDNTLR